MDSSEHPLTANPLQTSKVLVVDDDSRIVEVFSAILERDGYQIFSASDGQTALEIVRREQPDIIVLDVILPGLDGIEVCRQIKGAPETRFVPVILVTGLSARARRLDGLRAGADDFLSKPIDPLELTVRVRSLLRTKQLHDEVETNRRELERRVAERTRELRAAYEQLQQLSQVKGNALAIISHELRTPLYQAKAALSLVLEEGIAPERKAELLQTLEETFNLLEYRITDVAVFSDPTDLRLTPTSVSDLIAGAIQQVRTLRRRQADEIQLDVTKGLPPVMVSPMPMSRALAHIIHNSVKFGEGRPVTIRASSVQEGIKVTIEDQGIGIPSDLRPHLFDPLQTGDNSTTRRHSGMGIGLALVKMIFDAHKIAIDIQSEEGKGTIVSFVLPIVKLETL
jgi:two-component system sensor histidine kinase/response regulator